MTLILLALVPWKCTTQLHLDKAAAKTVVVAITDAVDYMTTAQASS